jgi:hypothetical protein
MSQPARMLLAVLLAMAVLAVWSFFWRYGRAIERRRHAAGRHAPAAASMTPPPRAKGFWLMMIVVIAITVFGHRHVPLRPLPLRMVPAADVYVGGIGIDSQGRLI